MNSWDETQASCASPQEQLFDCRWNVGGGGGGIGGHKNWAENSEQTSSFSVGTVATIKQQGR